MFDALIGLETHFRVARSWPWPIPIISHNHSRSFNTLNSTFPSTHGPWEPPITLNSRQEKAGRVRWSAAYPFKFIGQPFAGPQTFSWSTRQIPFRPKIGWVLFFLLDVSWLNPLCLLLLLLWTPQLHSGVLHTNTRTVSASCARYPKGEPYGSLQHD